MTAQMIDGKQIAQNLKEELKREVEALKSKGCTPGLATLLVGEDPASQIYVGSKHRSCQEVGIASFNCTLPKDATQAQVLAKVRQFNEDPQVHAILVQLPLPKHLDTAEILQAVRPDKDADGFHPENLGKLLSAKNQRELALYKKAVPLPCTPHGVMVLLRQINVEIAGKNAVVVGRSTIVGKPVALLLMMENATVTVAHSQTKNLVECCQQADILIAAVGKPKMIQANMIKPGAVVIDVGINRLPDQSICGDVDFQPALQKASWITPVPKGVGPMTIVMLLKNTITLAKSLS